MGSVRTIPAAVTVLAAGTLIGLPATDAGAAGPHICHPHPHR
jgi:hypothetical protein